MSLFCWSGCSKQIKDLRHDKQELERSLHNAQEIIRDYGNKLDEMTCKYRTEVTQCSAARSELDEFKKSCKNQVSCFDAEEENKARVSDESFNMKLNEDIGIKEVFKMIHKEESKKDKKKYNKKY